MRHVLQIESKLQVNSNGGCRTTWVKQRAQDRGLWSWSVLWKGKNTTAFDASPETKYLVGNVQIKRLNERKKQAEVYIINQSHKVNTKYQSYTKTGYRLRLEICRYMSPLKNMYETCTKQQLW